MEIKNLSLVLPIILLLFLSSKCQNNEDVQLEQSQMFDLAKYRKECMPIESVKINGVVPLLMPKEQFNQIFGQIDSSLLAPERLYLSLFPDTLKDACYYYFLGSSIFVSRGNYVHPLLVDFSKIKVKFHFNGAQFGFKSGIHDFVKTFPMSSRLYRRFIQSCASKPILCPFL